MIKRFLFVVLGLFFLSSGVLNGIKSQSSKTAAKETPSLTAPKNLVSDSVQTLKLMFAGDLMSQLPQIEAAQIGHDEYDYNPVFQYISPILKQADLCIGNLECTLPGEPPYTGYPYFRSPDAVGLAAKRAGFDVLVTANNHVNDSGLQGIYHTIEVLRQNNILQTGSFRDELSKKLMYPLLVYKNGFKIAIINYTHHTNGIITSAPALVNRMLDMSTVKVDIAAAKKLNPDFIIAFLHWGDEHKLYEGSIQRGVAQVLHEWGCGLVVGSHPHVVQPIKYETFGKSKTKKCLTAYSLGNFVSSQPFPNTEGGILFEVNLTKTNGLTTIQDYDYIPVLRYEPIVNGTKQFYILPISLYEDDPKKVDMSASEITKMRNFADKTRARLAEFDAPERFLK
jgi:poly-gamma-glutamate capsule biosynthesis protein CapA/YwtB (metallophosphatase superfamily)